MLTPLACSFLYAILVIPFLSSRLIKGTIKPTKIDLLQNRFFDILQRGYQWLLDLCFRHKKLTLLTGALMVLLGLFLFTQINIQIFPKAERDSFAVEIHGNATSSIVLLAEVVGDETFHFRGRFLASPY